ncbi:hypothetical protein KGMB02707_00370 [Mesosutterella multiformis]|nr:hypothetical protein KGMB02707_00370 [Mesosutterella multiformis]
MHVTSCRYLQVFYISDAGILSAAVRVGETERRDIKTMPGPLSEEPGMSDFSEFCLRQAES